MVDQGKSQQADAAFNIRPVRPSDNPAVARIIRQVMTEYDAVGCGFSINDPEVDSIYEAYPHPRWAFFVVEKQKRVLGCGGTGPLQGGEAGVCELRKMYFMPELRGAGIGKQLLGIILDAARGAGYSLCYLETLENMSHARKLYSKYGFEPIRHALGNTGHSSCNCFMTLKL
jgi:putative acetyltransferase